MTEDEKLESIPNLREKGNCLFKQKNFEAASDIYAKAIGILEQLMLALVLQICNNTYSEKKIAFNIVHFCSEKPNDEEWLALNEMKNPLLLNYAQCKLLNKEFYEVIEHCTTVLKTDKGWWNEI